MTYWIDISAHCWQVPYIPLNTKEKLLSICPTQGVPYKNTIELMLLIHHIPVYLRHKLRKLYLIIGSTYVKATLTEASRSLPTSSLFLWTRFFQHSAPNKQTKSALRREIMIMRCGGGSVDRAFQLHPARPTLTGCMYEIPSSGAIVQLNSTGIIFGVSAWWCHVWPLPTDLNAYQVYILEGCVLHLYETWLSCRLSEEWMSIEPTPSIIVSACLGAVWTPDRAVYRSKRRRRCTVRQIITSTR